MFDRKLMNRLKQQDSKKDNELKYIANNLFRTSNDKDKTIFDEFTKKDLEVAENNLSTISMGNK